MELVWFVQIDAKPCAQIHISVQYVLIYVQSISSIKIPSNQKNFKDIFRKHMPDKTRSSWLCIHMYSQFHISLKLVFILYFSIAFIDTVLGFTDSSSQIEGTYYHITAFCTITNHKLSTLLFFLDKCPA